MKKDRKAAYLSTTPTNERRYATARSCVNENSGIEKKTVKFSVEDGVGRRLCGERCFIVVTCSVIILSATRCHYTNSLEVAVQEAACLGSSQAASCHPCRR